MPGLAQKLVGAVNQLEGNFAFKLLQNSNPNSANLKKKVGVYISCSVVQRKNINLLSFLQHYLVSQCRLQSGFMWFLGEKNLFC